MFTSLYYFPLLVLTAIIYWLLPSARLRTIWLSVVSLSLIYYLDHKALAMTVMLTVFTFGIGYWMGKSARKKPLLLFGVAGIVVLLAYFKYYGFFAGTLDSLVLFFHGMPKIRWDKLAIPLGLSYLVFKHISYLIDVYWDKDKAGNLLELTFYSSLFTIYSAGPIERFHRLKTQLQPPVRKFETGFLNEGFIRITTGLFKKLVLADWLGYFIHPVWQNPSQYHPVYVSMAIVGYSLQIYFDFAGYSDIAIGSSRLLGLRIMENFDNPYLAKNIGDFWRRWHISLSEWIRDYLFVPLSRLSYIRAWMIYLVPPIAMGICGIWHGSDGHFLVWGLWHGIAIDIYQYFRKTKSKLLKALINTQLATFTFVTLAWIIFHDSPKTQGLHPGDYLIIIAALPLLLYPVQKLLGMITRMQFAVNAPRTSIMLLITLALQCFMNTDFIYMNF